MIALMKIVFAMNEEFRKPISTAMLYSRTFSVFPKIPFDFESRSFKLVVALEGWGK